MPIVPIRNDNAYVGISKQVSQGTPVAPSTFLRWLDGTKFEFDLKVESVWEGDGTRRLSQLIKNKQSVKMTINFNPRPVEMGLIEQMAMGSGSDTYTAPTTATTLASSVTAGATSISLAANTGLTSAGTAKVMLTPGSATEEIVTITTPGTGSGPYSYTIANSGTAANAHSSGDSVITSAKHVFTDQSDGDYYTVEIGLGSLNGGAGPTIRVADCKINSLKRESKAGMLLEYSMEIEGLATAAQGSPAVVTLENHSPFLFVQGAWTLNGSTSGDALAVESFDIQQKNGLDLVQTESLVPSAIIFGNLNIEVTANLVMQNQQLIALTYWGGTSGTTDSQTIGAGSLTLIFTQADGFHTVQYKIPTMHYSKITEPAPKKDGKHYNIGIKAEGVSNQGANTYLLQTTVQNGKTSAY